MRSQAGAGVEQPSAAAQIKHDEALVPEEVARAETGHSPHLTKAGLGTGSTRAGAGRSSQAASTHSSHKSPPSSAHTPVLASGYTTEGLPQKTVVKGREPSLRLNRTSGSQLPHRDIKRNTAAQNPAW